jgi:colicin import membrane protein
MKSRFPFFILLCLSLVSQAEESEATERTRIAAERGKAEADFRAEEKLCYRKFAVNDCLNAAKARRREVLANLRRQELSLNDAQRKRKAAERQEGIDQRALEKQQRREIEQQEALAAQEDRQARAAQKSRERAASDASRAASAADRQRQTAQKDAQAEADRNRRAAQTDQNAKKYQQRQLDAQEHKASLDRRLAKQKKPSPEPLPVPP